MPRHFFALVVGKGLSQRRGNRAEFCRKARQRGSGGGVFHLGEQHQAAGPLDQNADRRLISGALDEVALPMPRQQSVFDFGRPNMNADHIRNLSAPVCAPCCAAYACCGSGAGRRVVRRAAGRRWRRRWFRVKPAGSGRSDNFCWGDHFQSSRVRTMRQQTLCRQSLVGQRPALRRAALSASAGTDA